MGVDHAADSCLHEQGEIVNQDAYLRTYAHSSLDSQYRASCPDALLGYLIADGYLNFGGGEKDLLLLLPWLVWSVVYFVLFCVFWKRRFPVLKGSGYAAGGATGALVLIYVVMLIWFGAILGVS